MGSLWRSDFKESHLPQAIMKSLLVVSALVGALASVQAIKAGSETKVDSKSQWPYGSGYGMMGHGMMEDCMMCDQYHGCPSWCYGWNYPYQANVVISEKSDDKTTAQTTADSKDKWYGNGYGNQYGNQFGYPYGYQFGNQYGTPYGYQYGNQYGTPYGYQYGYPYGNQYGNQDDCKMCHTEYGCPEWCNGQNYPGNKVVPQTFAAVEEKSVNKADSKAKWWYGNGYGMMGHGM